MTQEMPNGTAVLETIRGAVDSAAAGTVFAEPITRDGLTVIPVAKVSGGGGGGGGNAPEGSGAEAAGTGAGGAGGGFGVTAKPLGVFVIKDGTVGWRPAVDVNRIIMGGQIVAVMALLTIRALIKARTRRR